MAEPGVVTGVDELRDEHFLFQHAEVAHGRRGHRGVGVSLARFREERHAAIVQHARNLADACPHVRDVVQRVQADRHVERAGPERETLHVTGDCGQLRAARP